MGQKLRFQEEMEKINSEMKQEKEKLLKTVDTETLKRVQTENELVVMRKELSATKQSAQQNPIAVEVDAEPKETNDANTSTMSLKKTETCVMACQTDDLIIDTDQFVSLPQTMSMGTIRVIPSKANIRATATSALITSEPQITEDDLDIDEESTLGSDEEREYENQADDERTVVTFIAGEERSNKKHQQQQKPKLQFDSTNESSSTSQVQQLSMSSTRSSDSFVDWAW